MPAAIVSAVVTHPKIVNMFNIFLQIEKEDQRIKAVERIVIVAKQNVKKNIANVTIAD